MWDVAQLMAQNNRAAIQSMMAGEGVLSVQNPWPDAWPLSWLADRLRVGPPTLSEIVRGLTDIGALEGFLNLIRTYLPDCEAELLAQSRSQRAHRFCYLFGKKYFPLPVNQQVTLVQLVDELPVELLGMSYSAYHELEMRPGYLMLLSLVVYPYHGDERDSSDDPVPFDPATISAQEKYTPRASDVTWLTELVAGLAVGGEWQAPVGFTVVKEADRKIRLRAAVDNADSRETIRRTLLVAESAGIQAKFTKGRKARDKTSGARVPLIDMVRHLVGPDIVGRIPSEGWTPEALHKMTDGSKYAGVAVFADWACSQTGCVVLDSAYDNCEWQEGSFGPSFKWTKENVHTLTEDWPKVKAIRKTIDKLVETLEANPDVVFRNLVEFLLVKAKDLTQKEDSRRYDFVEHWCPLDAKNDDEEVEIGSGG